MLLDSRSPHQAAHRRHAAHRTPVADPARTAHAVLRGSQPDPPVRRIQWLPRLRPLHYQPSVSPARPDPWRGDALDALFTLSRRWPTVHRQQGLSPGTTQVIRCFRPATGPLSVGGIADLLDIHPSAASRAVGAAVLGGHVDRRRPGPDLRVASLSLTARGVDLLDQVVEDEQQRLRLLLTGWRTPERVAAHAMLRRLAEGLVGPGTGGVA